MPTEGLIPNKDWKLIRVSSENTANEKFATHAIDDNPDTLWHTRFGDNPAKPPHELVIDLGAEHRIRGLVYLARQDGGWNGAIKDIEFYISESADKFGAPAAKATLTKTKAPQTIKCDETTGRYVLVRALSELNGNAFASAAEIGLLGD